MNASAAMLSYWKPLFNPVFPTKLILCLLLPSSHLYYFNLSFTFILLQFFFYQVAYILRCNDKLKFLLHILLYQEMKYILYSLELYLNSLASLYTIFYAAL